MGLHNVRPRGEGESGTGRVRGGTRTQGSACKKN
jgi:hypothetical protein